MPIETPATSETIRTAPVRQAIDRFWECLPPVWNTLRGHLHEIVAETNAAESGAVTVEQFHVLRQLRQGACSVSQLAETRQVSRPAVSQAVDTLVAKGLVSRDENPNDRRFVSLTLTQAGQALVAETFERNRAWMAERMACLDPAELEAVQQGMAALKKAFGE